MAERVADFLRGEDAVGDDEFVDDGFQVRQLRPLPGLRPDLPRKRGRKITE
jgi:hypothetical protein